MNVIRFGILAMLVTIQSASAQPRQDAVITRSDTVTVSGLVKHRLSITAAATQGLELKPSPAHDMRNGKGELKKVIPAFKGYLLKDLVEKAVPVMPEHKDGGKFIIVITATDGYTVIFSYNELVHGPAAGSAWLIPAAGVGPLEGDGPFVVLCTSDDVSAPRYVKRVRSIEVRKI